MNDKKQLVSDLATIFCGLNDLAKNGAKVNRCYVSKECDKFKKMKKEYVPKEHYLPFIRFKYIIILCGTLYSCNSPQKKVKAKSDCEKLNFSKNCHYEPTLTCLTGVIKNEICWGPPNFGEDTTTDRKEIHPILNLSYPINMIADTSNYYNTFKKGIRRIQLIFPFRLDSVYLGKTVLVKGKLFGAQTGHHYTDVLLMVTELH